VCTALTGDGAGEQSLSCAGRAGEDDAVADGFGADAEE